MHNNCNY